MCWIDNQMNSNFQVPFCCWVRMMQLNQFFVGVFFRSVFVSIAVCRCIVFVALVVICASENENKYIVKMSVFASVSFNLLKTLLCIQSIYSIFSLSAKKTISFLRLLQSTPDPSHRDVVFVQFVSLALFNFDNQELCFCALFMTSILSTYYKANNIYLFI